MEGEATRRGIALSAGSDDHFSLSVGKGSVTAQGKDWKGFLEEIVAGNGEVDYEPLTYERALEESAYVVDLFLGGNSDDWEAFANLTNQTAARIGRVYSKLLLPRPLKKRINAFLARIGSKKLIDSQKGMLTAPEG